MRLAEHCKTLQGKRCSLELHILEGCFLDRTQYESADPSSSLRLGHCGLRVHPARPRTVRGVGAGDAGHPSVEGEEHAAVEDMAGCTVAAELDHRAVGHKVVAVGPAAAAAAGHIPEAQSSDGSFVVPGELEDAAEGHEAGHVRDAIVEA